MHCCLACCAAVRCSLLHGPLRCCAPLSIVLPVTLPYTAAHRIACHATMRHCPLCHPSHHHALLPCLLRCCGLQPVAWPVVPLCAAAHCVACHATMRHCPSHRLLCCRVL